MDTSIPKNLTQCVFNFDALNSQPIEDAPVLAGQTIPQKRCPRCKDKFPATSAYFNKDKSTKDGLFSICKRCRGSKNFGIEVPEKTAEGYRRCSTCNKVYILTEEYFHRGKTEFQGFDYQCKECKNKRSKKYSMRPEVREKRLVREKAWNDAHKEEHKEYYKVYNQVNKESESARSKRYYQAHKEHTRARHKRHYQQNKALYRAIGRAYRARHKSVGGKHTPEQIQAQLERQKYRCYYAACNHAKFKKINGKYIYHIEHTFPISRVAGTDIPANSIDYLVLSCPFCNLSKGDKFPWEWPDGGRLC